MSHWKYLSRIQNAMEAETTSPISARQAMTKYASVKTTDIFMKSRKNCGNR